jgi:hypothetical protein
MRGSFVPLVICAVLTAVSAHAASLTAGEEAELKDRLAAAENASVNPRVGIETGLWSSVGAVRLLDNPAGGNSLYANDFNYGLSVAFRVRPDYKSRMNVQFLFDNLDDGSLGEPRSSEPFSWFQSEFSVSSPDYSANISLNGPFYNKTGSELTAGDISKSWGDLYFERRNWYQVSLPADYYRELSAGNKLVVSDQNSDNFTGVKGGLLELSQFPLGVDLRAFFGRTYDIGWAGSTVQNYGSGTWFWFGSLKKKIGSGRIGLHYAGHAINTGLTRKNDEEVSLVSMSLQSAFRGFNFSGEAGWSRARRPLRGQGPEDGFAVIGSASRAWNRLFFFRKLDSNLRVYWSTPEYYGQLNAVYNVKPIFPGDPQAAVYAPESVGHFNAGSVSVFLVNKFRFLKGLMMTTWGTARDSVVTDDKFRVPHHLNHKVWYDLKDGLKTAGLSTLEHEWVIDNEGVTEGLTYPGSSSRKGFSLARIDWAVNLADWVPLRIPVYYFLRGWSSGVFSTASWFPEAGARERLFHLRMLENFTAVGVLPSFYLIGFYGVESFAADHAGVRRDMTGTGWGAGFDFYPRSSGLGLYARFRVFDEKDAVRPAFDFNGWSASLEAKFNFRN